MKVCPNCGSKITINTNYCENCGYKITNSNNSTESNHVDKVDYFTWFINSIKNPKKAFYDNTHNYFAIISIVISFSFLIFIIHESLPIIISYLKHLFAVGEGSTSYHYVYGLVGNKDQPKLLKLFIELHSSIPKYIIFEFAIFFATTIGIPYLILNTICKNKVVFLDFVGSYSSYSNLVIPIELVTSVFFVLKVNNIIILLLLLIIPLIYIFASCLSLMDHNKRFNNFHLLILYVVIETIILSFVSEHVLNIILERMGHVGHEIFNYYLFK